jgi:ABC-type branched-subunit amino acid transport system ATPase component
VEDEFKKTAYECLPIAMTILAHAGLVDLDEVVTGINNGGYQSIYDLLIEAYDRQQEGLTK